MRTELRGIALLAGLCAACTGGGTRSETRASISGRVVLARLDGAQDMSRVRVDIGRGEGGVPPQPDGSFEFSDLEPDVYALTIGYAGGLTATAAGSAYRPWSARVVARAGGSVALGEVALTPGAGSVRGVVTLGGEADARGVVVRLLGADGSREVRTADGTFVFTDVRVGTWAVVVERENFGSFCGSEVTVAADGEEAVVPPITLQRALPVIAPQAADVFGVEGTRWFARGSSVRVDVSAPFAREQRHAAGLADAAAPSYASPATTTVTLDAAGAETPVFFQFRDACGLETQRFTFTLVRDTDPPLVDELRVNGGTAITRERTVGVVLSADDLLSPPLRMKLSSCDETETPPACVPDLGTTPWLEFRPIQSATLDGPAGPKRVRVVVRDRSENEVARDTPILFDPDPPVVSAVVIDNPSGTIYSPEATVYVTATDRTAMFMKAYSDGSAPPASWAPFQATFTHAFPPGAGAHTLTLQLKDEAGNPTLALPYTVTLRTTGTVRGSVVLEGRSAHDGVHVALAGTQYSADSDSGGAWSIQDVPAGVYDVDLAHAGFEARRIWSVIVDPREPRDLGEVRLAALKARVTGTVILEGQTSHQGATVTLESPTGLALEPAITDAGGRFTLAVPEATYARGALRVHRAMFRDTAFDSPIIALENETFDVGVLNLVATENDVLGTVTLDGRTDCSGVVVTISGESGTATETVPPRTVTTAVAGAFEFRAMPVGLYRLHLEHPLAPGYESLDFANVLVGPGSVLRVGPFALREQYIRVRDTDPTTPVGFTRNPTVKVTIGASQCARMQVGNDRAAMPDDTADPSWVPCAASLDGWALSPGEGTKTVWARFTTPLSPTSPGGFVSDTIELDSRADVVAFTHNALGPLGLGDTIHLRLVTDDGTGTSHGETGGRATAAIAGYAQDIPLYDDGTHGDTASGDGIYELDYRIFLAADVPAATLTGYFVDRVGNTDNMVATDLYGTETPVTISIPPLISNIQVLVRGTQATISWSTDEDATGRVLWDTSAITWPPPPSVTEVTATNPTPRTHSVTFSPGSSSTVDYHFVIEAVDNALNPGRTADRIFRLVPGQPVRVVAVGGMGRVHVRWEAPGAADLRGFHIYRSTNVGGPFTRLTSTPFLHEALVYEDRAVVNNTTYHYRVRAVDRSDNEGPDSEVATATPGPYVGPTRVGPNLDLPVRVVGSQAWDERHSPYTIHGSGVTVDVGATLVIGPGVEVRVEKPADSADPPYRIVVLGRIAVIGQAGATPPAERCHAEGTAEGMVYIHSAEAVPAVGDWQEIYIDQASPDSWMDFENRQYLAGNLLYRARIADGNAALRVGSRAVYWEVSNGVFVLRSVLEDLYDGLYAEPYLRDQLLQDTCVQRVRSRAFHLGAEKAVAARLTVRADATTPYAAAGLLRTNCATPAQPWTCHGVLEDLVLADLPYGLSLQGKYRAFRVDASGIGSVDSYGNWSSGTAVSMDSSYVTPEGVKLVSVADSTFRDNNTHVYGGILSSSTLQGGRYLGMYLGDAYGSVFTDNGCIENTVMPSTQCRGASYWGNGRVWANRFLETGAVTLFNRGRMYVSGLSDVQFNEFSGGTLGYPAVAVESPGDAYLPPSQPPPLPALTSNSFLVPWNAGEIIVEMVKRASEYGYVLFHDEYNAVLNWWPAAVRAEVQPAVLDTNIGALRDFHDDNIYQRIHYKDFTTPVYAASAYPLPRITAPAWGQVFHVGDTVTLTGSATDGGAALGPADLRWFDDTGSATPLGAGATLPLTSLAPGYHRFWLDAVDADNQHARIPIEFEVWPAP